jgi:hypothetical protein
MQNLSERKENCYFPQKKLLYQLDELWTLPTKAFPLKLSQAWIVKLKFVQVLQQLTLLLRKFYQNKNTYQFGMIELVGEKVQDSWPL